MPSSSLLVVGAGFGRHDEGRVGQPVEVVETAVQVAPEVGRRAFVAEELPHERLVVERDDRGRLQELEERRALGLGQRLELRVGVELGERARAVEPRDALLDLPRDGLVAVGRRLDLADDRLVGLVGGAVVGGHRAGGAQGGLPRAVGELVVHVLPLSSEDRAPPIRSPATSGPTLSDPLCGVKHVGNRCPTAGARGPFRATGEAPAPGGYGAVRAMLLLLAFAFLAGAGTALSPCVLPVLPAVLSAGGAGGRRRPLGVVLGLAATFTITIVGVAEVVGGVGLGTDPLRALAVFVLAGFGIALLFPSGAARLEGPPARPARPPVSVRPALARRRVLVRRPRRRRARVRLHTVRRPDPRGGHHGERRDRADGRGRDRVRARLGGRPAGPDPRRTAAARTRPRRRR